MAPTDAQPAHQRLAQLAEGSVPLSRRLPRGRARRAEDVVFLRQAHQKQVARPKLGMSHRAAGDADTVAVLDQLAPPIELHLEDGCPARAQQGLLVHHVHCGGAALPTPQQPPGRGGALGDELAQ